MNYTWEVTEREVSYIWPTDLQYNTILRKSKLWSKNGVLVVAIQELVRIFVWIQDCELRSSNPVFDCGFIMIINDAAKWLIQRLAKWMALRVGDTAKGDGALPPSVASGKPAFGWTPVA